MENNNFDAVQFMRTIREKLSDKYWKHPDILKKDMQAIQEKYNLKVQPPEAHINLKAS